MKNALTMLRLQLRFAALSMICVVLASESGFAQPGRPGGRGLPGLPPQQSPETDAFELPGLPELPTQDPLQGVRPPSFENSRVNEQYAGWRQASDGTGGQRLDDTLRAQWVMADDSGRLSGIVYGIEGADVGGLTITLLNKGREVTTTKPKEDGTFVFANVKQDAYAIVGWGENAFFAFSFNVLKFNEALDENVPTELAITAVPNETTINTDWITYFATGVKFPVYGKHETGEGENDPPRLYGYEGQSLYLPTARPATSISSHQVIPAADGRLIGRVHQMTSRNGRPVDLQNTRILLLQNDDVYAAVTSDSYGVFEFPEIPPGEYSCVAVGADGLGCIGIYVADTMGNGADEEEDDEAEDGELDEADFEMDDDLGIDEDLYAPISFCMVTSETVGWLNNKAAETAYQRIIARPIYNYEEYQPQGNFGQGGGCCPRGSLRPGGYRPGPRSSIPKDQRFLPRFNRTIDRFFNRDTGTIQ